MTNFTQFTFRAPNLDGSGKHELAYLDWGSPDAKNTVLCVHGLTRNAHDFDAVAAALAKAGNRVLALDMAGRGDSEYLEDTAQYSYPAYMADCLAFLDNFHLRSVDWVGTSMGGIIGMMIAATSPGRIKRMVLNDVGSFIPAGGLKTIMNYVSATPTFYDTQEKAQEQLRQNLASFGITDDAHWQHFFAHSIKPNGEGFSLAFDPHIIDPIRAETNDFTEIDDVNLSELWDAINIPTLIVRGQHSTLLEPETVKAMRASNPKAQAVEIPDVGHAPLLLNPKEYQKIVNFIAGSALIPSNLRAS